MSHFWCVVVFTLLLRAQADECGVQREWAVSSKAALCSDSHNGKIDFEVLLQSRLSSYNKVWLGRFIVD